MSRSPKNEHDVALVARLLRNYKARARVGDRRRFRDGTVPTGSAAREVSPDATGTQFPSTVLEIGSGPVLIDGAYNSKIGGDVLVGRLEGAKIFTLALEERATCPRSCAIWTRCYGNSMPMAKRWRHGPRLERRLQHEVADLCRRHSKVLVRLHTLGDFYSFGYLALWAGLLDTHENLFVFGFTAWEPDSEIGAGIVRLREALPGRFSIRHSGRCEPWGAFTIDFPTSSARIGNAVVCPEQRAAMGDIDRADHCGACGMCWANSAPIAFVEH